MNEPEEQFADGNVSQVVRVGATVRRATGPWSPTVHALLRHLEQVGFVAAQRFLGIDERGREILSFMPGATIPASLDGYRDDATLIAAASLLRCYHDATLGFQPPAEAAWRFVPTAPRAGDVICHNDFAPYNVVIAEGHVSSLIDWDFAAPGPRWWDIAYALWRFVPLYADDLFGPPAERARRISVFCDAYGLEDRRELLDAIRARQNAAYQTLKIWAEEGQPAFVKMWQEGHAVGVMRDMAYLERHWEELGK